MDEVLPKLLSAEQKIGVIKPEIATLFGFNENVIVSTGGGDNMMGAIGTGNIREGIATMSLGTSGTLYAYTQKPLLNLPPMIANFCSSNNGWLPLVCVMNITSSNKQLMNLLNIDIEELNQLAQQASIGANGITILPFFNGERVPPLPNAKASILGLDSSNFTRKSLSSNDGKCYFYASLWLRFISSSWPRNLTNSPNWRWREKLILAANDC